MQKSGTLSGGNVDKMNFSQNKSFHEPDRKRDHFTGDCIFIKQQNTCRRVLFENVLYLKAAGSYCYIFLDSGVRLMVSRALASVMAEFPKYFLRVHRSFVINTERVDSYLSNCFRLGNYEIPIGRVYKKVVLEYIKVI